MSDLTDAASFNVSEGWDLPDECLDCEMKRACPHEHVLKECYREDEQVERRAI